jgi:PhoPQ-activated pathogenicity-related protein
MPRSGRRSCLAVVALFACAAGARADLLGYVAKPDATFAWKLKQKIDHPDGVVYDLELTSQTWQTIPWKHQLQVYQPRGVAPHKTMLLYNTGNAASLGNITFGMELAKKVQAPTAFLYHIPNQPLFDGKKEDALIAETFVRALETRDFDWPLLFPMVKSVVRAMDAVQAFAREEWKFEVKSFVVSGASKRGWTTWLTAATGDPRVVAIAPLVIDTLNMQDQMAHQLKSFGAYSEMLRDYTARNLVPLPPGDDAKKLWGMVDPYFYRDKLTVPKLLINGNNDAYWTVDALNLYWDGLKGDKYVSYVPNAGHNLQQPGGDRSRTLNVLAAFVRHQMTGKPLPKLEWQGGITPRGDAFIALKSGPAPLATRAWLAAAETRDFRKAKWEEQKTEPLPGGARALVDLPKEGFRCFYVEAEYEIDGIRYTLSTQVRVLAAKTE